MAKKSIIREAVDEAKQLREHAYMNAKNVFANEMSSKVKKAVDKMLDEELGGGGDPPANYDEDGEQKRVDDNLPAVGDSGEEMQDDGDGAAIIEDELEGEEEGDEGLGDEGLGEEEPGDEWMEEEDEMDDLGGGGDEELDIDVVDDEEGDDEGMGEEEIPEIEPEEDGFGDGEDDDEEFEMAEDEIPAPSGDEQDTEPTVESSVRRMKKESSRLRRENAEIRRIATRALRAVRMMKEQMSEVNLFNARLLGLQKINRRFKLQEGQVRKVSARFDECNSITEVKRVYRALVEGFTSAQRVSRNRIRRPNHQPAASRRINEGTAYTRMQQLANL